MSRINPHIILLTLIVTLVSHFNHGFAYWIYGVMSVLAALFVWKWASEIKGRSLEQI